MNCYELIDTIKTKEEFLHFLQELQKDRHNKPAEWESNTIVEYLEAVKSWVEDMDGYYVNLNFDESKNIDWSFIAALFYVGKIYE